ncbi:ead/Ea22-like family protein [Salmonella enterica]|nr:ead/Ea22-like family protein [Salmonella enterica]
MKDKQALRKAAEKATKGPWKVFSDIDTKTFSIHTPRDKRCENVIKWVGFDCQPNAEANAEFIAAFNPKAALALLDELEATAHSAAVDHEAACSLVEENEELKRRIAELEAKLSKPVLLPKTNGYWTEQEKAYEEAITLAKRQVRLAGFNVEEM